MSEATAIVPSKAVGGLPYLSEYLNVSNTISKTELVPDALKGRPEAILAVMLAGSVLGIGPMQALQSINIIKGKPALSAELMRALVLSAGHQIIVEANDLEATATCKRQGWEDWKTVSFSLDDAKRAGLTSNPVWSKYPRAMVSARVTSEACRLYFPDIISGLSYTPEEIESIDLPDTSAHPSNGNAAPRAAALRVVPDPAPADEVYDAEVVEAPIERRGPKPITEKQMGLIKKLLVDLGFNDAKARGDYIKALAGREVANLSQLTSFEASKVIDALKLVEEGSAQEVVADFDDIDGRPF